ncbi:hypothetical protein H2203_006902 [Taxawa tesnikishii (nom. ined.)]|nr:hypothetical protein H2203_006902 [Dothideales sp. JES 119]
MSASSEIVVAGLQEEDPVKITASRRDHLFIIAGLSPEQFPPDTPRDANAQGSKTRNRSQAQGQPQNQAADREARRARREAVQAENAPKYEAINNKRKRSASNDSEEPADSTDVKRRRTSLIDRAARSLPAVEEESASAAASKQPTPDADDGPDSSPEKNPIASLPHTLPIKVVKRTPKPPVVPKIKRVTRRTGRQPGSAQASRAPTPVPVEPLAPEDDVLADADLPSPFMSSTPTPDPEEPDDEAQQIYHANYRPMASTADLIAALTKFNPVRRSTENLYDLAENTAEILRQWQDEYLQLDQITAPHAAVPRKPATGSRQPVSQELFEDTKESELYDYTFDPKKLGFQDPIAQQVVRDASGRELRQRQQRGRIDVTAVVSEDEGNGKRTRKPVSKYDGVTSDVNSGRKKDVAAMSETPELDSMPWRRTRGSGVRGGRGGRGRGGLIGRRIQEMRAESVGIGETDEAGSESEAGDLSRAGSAAPGSEPRSQSPTPAGEDTDGVMRTKRKGRPKGSKNLQKRSDAGIPKGPRKPKPVDAMQQHVVQNYGSPLKLGYPVPSAPPAPASAFPTPHSALPAQHARPIPPAYPSPASMGTTVNGAPGLALPAAPGTAQQTAASAGGSRQRKVPKSDKRSASMVKWWAMRKEKQAQQKIADLRAQGVQLPAAASASVAAGIPLRLALRKWALARHREERERWRARRRLEVRILRPRDRGSVALVGSMF